MKYCVNSVIGVFPNFITSKKAKLIKIGADFVMGGKADISNEKKVQFLHD